MHLLPGLALRSGAGVPPVPFGLRVEQASRLYSFATLLAWLRTAALPRIRRFSEVGFHLSKNQLDYTHPSAPCPAELSTADNQNRNKTSYACCSRGALSPRKPERGYCLDFDD
jgi:hypothetical protein